MSSLKKRLSPDILQYIIPKEQLYYDNEYIWVERTLTLHTIDKQDYLFTFPSSGNKLTTQQRLHSKSLVYYLKFLATKMKKTVGIQQMNYKGLTLKRSANTEIYLGVHWSHCFTNLLWVCSSHSFSHNSKTYSTELPKSS